MSYARFPASAIAPYMVPDVVASLGGYYIGGERAKTKNGILVAQPGWERGPATSLVNGDFSAGTTGWTAIDSTLTTEVYDGKRCLKITATGAGPAFAYQDCGLVAGNKYQFKVFLAGDGDSTPSVPRIGSYYVVFGTGNDAVATWVEIDSYGQTNSSPADLARIYLTTAGGIGSVARVADLRIGNVSLPTLHPQVDAGVFQNITLAQSTDINRPWDTVVNGRHGINLGSLVTDRRYFNLSLPQQQVQTVYIAVYHTTLTNAYKRLLVSDNTATNPCIYIETPPTKRCFW